jgi:hypothetical protein
MKERKNKKNEGGFSLKDQVAARFDLLQELVQ